MTLKKTLFTSVTAFALLAGSVTHATHGRGMAIIPEVDGSGLLSLELISYWDPTGISQPSSVNFSVTGPTGTTFVNAPETSLDLSDARREESIYSGSLLLTSPGLYTISWDTCCLTGGIRNIGADDLGTVSTIYWDGQNATKPILFDLENIQQEVVRGDAYSDGLDAVAGAGMTLSYGASMSSFDTSGVVPPGYVLDPVTGVISIDATSTAGYLDNSSRPDGGADYLFSGMITASDGSMETGSIEFFWLFDAVDSTGPGNRAPEVSDIVINALVGDTINTIVTATDPDGDTVTLSFDAFFGAGNPSNQIFDPATGAFTWDSTGFAVGQYIAFIEGSDGSISDIGTITINLRQGDTVVPLPASAVLLLTGVGGIAVMRRRRNKATPKS